VCGIFPLVVVEPSHNKLDLGDRVGLVVPAFFLKLVKFCPKGKLKIKNSEMKCFLWFSIARSEKIKK
jgi:hypothetical protein